MPFLTGPVDTDMTRGIDWPKASPESAAVAFFDGVEKGKRRFSLIAFPNPLPRAGATA